MADRAESVRSEPRCVGHLFACVERLADAFERREPTGIYTDHLTLGDVGRCPALCLNEETRTTLEAALRDARTTLSLQRSCPDLSPAWGGGRLRAVIKEARRQLETVNDGAVATALEAPRCENCRHAKSAA
ncbi:MAG: hypothetical protein ACR2PO_19720 [Methyloligellaceae bacterium]